TIANSTAAMPWRRPRLDLRFRIIMARPPFVAFVLARPLTSKKNFRGRRRPRKLRWLLRTSGADLVADRAERFVGCRAHGRNGHQTITISASITAYATAIGPSSTFKNWTNRPTVVCSAKGTKDAVDGPCCRAKGGS